MKQSCCFAKVYDREFNKKHIGVNLFSLQLRVHEKCLIILCEKGTNCVSTCWELLLKDFMAIERSFDKSRKLMIL